MRAGRPIRLLSSLLLANALPACAKPADDPVELTEARHIPPAALAPSPPIPAPTASATPAAPPPTAKPPVPLPPELRDDAGLLPLPAPPPPTSSTSVQH